MPTGLPSIVEIAFCTGTQDYVHPKVPILWDHSFKVFSIDTGPLKNDGRQAENGIESTSFQQLLPDTLAGSTRKEYCPAPLPPFRRPSAGC